MSAAPQEQVVLDTLQRLGFDRRDAKVTTADVAKFLLAEKEQVAGVLHDLELARRIRRRSKGGRTIWLPGVES